MSFELSLNLVGHKRMASRVVRDSKPNSPPNEGVKVSYLCGKRGEYMTKTAIGKMKNKNHLYSATLQIVTFVKKISCSDRYGFTHANVIATLYYIVITN